MTQPFATYDLYLCQNVSKVYAHMKKAVQMKNHLGKSQEKP